MPRLAAAVTALATVGALTADAAAEVTYVVIDPANPTGAPAVHALREPAPPPPPHDGSYLGVSAVLGGAVLPDHDGGTFDDLHLGLGASLDVGVRLADAVPVFAHAQIGLGSSGKVGWADDDNPSGVYFTARGGAELRGCGAWACLVGGLDAGVASFEYVSVTSLQIVPRGGFEIGRGATRFRSTVEAAYGVGDASATAFTTTLGISTAL